MKRISPVLLLPVLAVTILIANVKLGEQRKNILPHPPLADMEASPPILTLIQMGLGGFRGLVVDILWLRASILKEQSRFVELVQLSEWITKLDPHAADAWSYHAWNMAYNVSIMLRRPRDRWRWVQHGIRLLRDEGLRYNPAEAAIYYELGWLYQHKIGSSHDRTHLYYKCSQAEWIAPFLGPEGHAPRAGNTEAETGLRNRFGMRADFMRDIDERFAPLDWRLPESCAIYWAWLGLKLNDRGKDLSLRRMIYQNLISGVTGGRLIEYDLETRTWKTEPNRALIPETARFLKESRARYPAMGIHGPYLRFLALAVYMDTRADNDFAARERYAELRKEALQQGKTPPAFETVAAGDFSHPLFTPD